MRFRNLLTSQAKLLDLRENARFVRIVSRPFFVLFSRWIAGANATSVLLEAKRLSQKNIKSVLNFLGEHYLDPQLVEHAVHEYRHLVRRISRERHAVIFAGVNGFAGCAVSIKPSQFGFDLELPERQSQKICFEFMRSVVEEAFNCSVPVEIDMEDSKYTGFSLFFFKKMLEEFGKNGLFLRLCLQANLKRTEKDLSGLAEFCKKNGFKAGIRLVKGVYPESEKTGGIEDEKQVLQNFFLLVQKAFEHSGVFDIAIGTHRQDIVVFADDLSAKKNTPFELQLLKGVGFKVKQARLAKNQLFTEYLPYGKDAVAYTLRRAKKLAGL